MVPRLGTGHREGKGRALDGLTTRQRNNKNRTGDLGAGKGSCRDEPWREELLQVGLEGLLYNLGWPLKGYLGLSCGCGDGLPKWMRVRTKSLRSC